MACGLVLVAVFSEAVKLKPFEALRANRQVVRHHGHRSCFAGTLVRSRRARARSKRPLEPASGANGQRPNPQHYDDTSTVANLWDSVGFKGDNIPSNLPNGGKPLTARKKQLNVDEGGSQQFFILRRRDFQYFPHLGGVEEGGEVPHDTVRNSENRVQSGSAPLER